MFCDKPLDSVEFECGEATVPHQLYRLEPELCHLPVAAHVNVHRFHAIYRIEEKTVRPDSQYGRHGATKLAPGAGRRHGEIGRGAPHEAPG
jgi:hypothetical protein